VFLFEVIEIKFRNGIKDRTLKLRRLCLQEKIKTMIY